MPAAVPARGGARRHWVGRTALLGQLNPRGPRFPSGWLSAGRGTGRGCGLPLEGDQRDVILLLPALSGKSGELGEQVLDQTRAAGVVYHEGLQARDTEHLALRAVGFHQPVAVEQKGLSSFEKA